MRKMRAAIMSIAAAGALVLVAYACTVLEGREIMGVPMLSQKATEEMLTRQETVVDLSGYIQFNGIALPYDTGTHTVYIAQSASLDEWMGDITILPLGSVSEPWLAFGYDTYFSQKEQAIAEGHSFTMFVSVNRDTYAKVNVVCSGLPVLNMKTGEFVSEIEKTAATVARYRGTFTLFDPSNTNTDNYRITESDMTFNIKGSTTMNFPKKSYSVHLKKQDEDGEWVSRKESLLSMRKDDDWQLNAMYSDASLSRDKVSQELWNNMAKGSNISAEGLRMQYIEVVLDGWYMGIYGLTEPIDAKKLKLQEGDILYKAKTFKIPDFEEFTALDDNTYHSPVLLKYPKDYFSVEETQEGEETVYHIDYNPWLPMKELLENLIVNEEPSLAEAERLLYLDNMVDVYLLVQMIGGTDNAYKNTFFASKELGNGSYRTFAIPFDFNYSFGDIMDEEEVDLTRFSLEEAEKLVEVKFVTELLKQKPEEMMPLLSTRYRELRGTVFQKNRLLEEFKSNGEYLEASGAFVRNQNRWREAEYSTELENAALYLDKRLAYLDEVFGYE